jgi:cytochrome c oxidase assembly protein subunit 15
MAEKAHPGLHRFALFTAASTFLLIIAGALVTSNDAGLSVPDWPLSYGQLMPPMIGGIFYEHGHRMIASFVGMLTIVLAVWLWRVEDRGWVKKLGLAALAAVVAQGVLGGLTVIFLLPTAVSVGHACLAQLFFSMVVSLALVTSPGWRGAFRGSPAADEGSPSLRALCLAANCAIFAQLMLGAAFRHKGFGIVPHLAGAALVAVLVVWLIARVVSSFAGQTRLFRWALTLNALVMLQLVLGSAAYWIRLLTASYPQPMLAMVALTVAHVALGALILATSVLLTFEVWAGVSKPSPDFVDRKVVTAA